MGPFSTLWQQGDGVTRAVGLLLLTLSISAWVVIFWKGWMLQRARRDIERSITAFWSASDLSTARAQLQGFDREQVVLPLLDAALQTPDSGSLEASGHLDSQLTRRLREALNATVRRLQFGQVLLASIGSTAPFIGLFGTVWGIYHALMTISNAGAMTIDKVAGPVGEALIMTAIGLVVAIPAVLAYNILGKLVMTCEVDLEGFAHDLREMRVDQARA